MLEKQIILLKHGYAQAYVVRINRLNIMIDCGYPESFTVFVKALSRQNIAFSQINYLVITHFHPDHAGLVQPLTDLGVPLLMLENQKGYTGWLNDYYEKHYNRKKGRPHQNYKPIEQDGVLLSADESEKLFSTCKGKMISTPGHSDDSITFIVDDVAFTGDLPKYDESGLYKSEQIQNSWRKIRENNVKEIYPGHGLNYLIT